MEQNVRNKEHCELILAGDWSPRVIEVTSKREACLLFYAWTKSREGPPRYDYPAAAADLRDLISKEKAP